MWNIVGGWIWEVYAAVFSEEKRFRFYFPIVLSIEMQISYYPVTFSNIFFRVIITTLGWFSYIVSNTCSTCNGKSIFFITFQIVNVVLGSSCNVDVNLLVYLNSRAGKNVKMSVLMDWRREANIRYIRNNMTALF